MPLPAALYLNELLLLFVVVTTGLWLGRVKFAGISLGVAGVLFAGLGWGLAGHQEAQSLGIISILRDFGLVVFVHTVGLTSGPGFFSALRERGLALNAAVALALVLGAASSRGLGHWRSTRWPWWARSCSPRPCSCSREGGE